MGQVNDRSASDSVTACCGAAVAAAQAVAEGRKRTDQYDYQQGCVARCGAATLIFALRSTRAGEIFPNLFEPARSSAPPPQVH